jgi:hypothetical protein
LRGCRGVVGDSRADVFQRRAMIRFTATPTPMPIATHVAG